MKFDVPTKLTHWVLALCVLLNHFFIEGGDAHDYIGYLAAALVIFRVAWYFKLGSVARPNILAKFTYILIWSIVLALGITGWMMSLDRYWGEEWLEVLHTNLSIGLQVLIGLHLSGIVLDSIRHRRAAWKVMFFKRPYS